MKTDRQKILDIIQQERELIFEIRRKFGSRSVDDPFLEQDKADTLGRLQILAKLEDRIKREI